MERHSVTSVPAVFWLKKTKKTKSFCKAMYDISQWKNVVSIIFTVYLQQINTISGFHIKPNWHVYSSFKTFCSLVSLKRKKKTRNHNKEPLPNYKVSSCHVLHQLGDVRECIPPQPCWRLNRYCDNGCFCYYILRTKTTTTDLYLSKVLQCFSWTDYFRSLSSEYKMSTKRNCCTLVHLQNPTYTT